MDLVEALFPVQGNHCLFKPYYVDYVCMYELTMANETKRKWKQKQQNKRQTLSKHDYDITYPFHIYQYD